MTMSSPGSPLAPALRERPRYLISSRRGARAEDPIFALHGEAMQRQADGEHVINATLGTLHDDRGELVVLGAATRALAAVRPEEWASYAPIAGPPAFLEAVKQELLAGAPALLGRAAAVATPGGTGALRHALTMLLEDGEELLTTSYHWSPYATIASENGRRLVTFPMFRPDGGFSIEALADGVGASIRRQGKAVVLLNDPCHNPTGYTMTEREWADVAFVLAEFGARAPVSVIVDSAYAAFSEGAHARPLAALGAVADRVLVAFCWSASKTFLQYGLRVGALVVVPPEPSQTAEFEAALAVGSRGTWSTCNHGGMRAITRLLGERHWRAQVDRERGAVLSMLGARVRAWNARASARGLRHPRYDGGFFVTVPAGDPQGLAARLREASIFVVPLQAGVRVALCSVATAEVPRLVDGLADASQGNLIHTLH